MQSVQIIQRLNIKVSDSFRLNEVYIVHCNSYRLPDDGNCFWWWTEPWAVSKVLIFDLISMNLVLRKESWVHLSSLNLKFFD